MASDDGMVEFESLQIPRATQYLDNPKFRKEAGYCGPEYRNFECEMFDWFTLSPGDGDFYRYNGHDKTMLRYLRIPSDPRHTNFDLNIEHEEDAQELRFNKSSSMYTFLQFIVSEAQENARCCELLKRPDLVICKNDTLRNIMFLPYMKSCSKFKQLPTMINAVKIGRTIYMVIGETQEQKDNVEYRVYGPDERGRNYTKQGLKFEHYMLADGPDEEPRPSEKPVLRRRKLLQLVCEATFAGHNILYAFKQNGLDGHPDMLDNLPIPTFITCTKKAVTPVKNHPWERLLLWWENSILTKAQKFIIGHRQENGFVNDIDIIPANELLRKAATEYLKKFPHTNICENNSEHQSLGKGVFASNWRTGKPMKPQEPPKLKLDAESELGNIFSDMCFGFLARFLDYLKATLPQGMGEGPDVVYQFSWHPDKDDRVTCRKLTGEAGVAAAFIPDWYMSHLQQNGLTPA